MRGIVSTMMIGLMSLAPSTQAQILPDAGDQSGHSILNVTDRFQRGGLEAMSCGDLARRYANCFRFVPIDPKSEAVCMIGQAVFKLPEAREHGPKSQFALYDRDHNTYGRVLTFASNLENKRKGDQVNGLFANEHPCEDFKSQQDIKPEALLPMPLKVSLQSAGHYLKAAYIDDCLLAERKLAFTSTSHGYKTMDFVCIMFPAADHVSVSGLALDYVNDLNAYSDWKTAPKLLKKYSAGKHQAPMFAQRMEGDDWVNIKCLEDLRVAAILEKDIQAFYQKANAKAEIPPGHDAIMFARNRTERCPSME